MGYPGRNSIFVMDGASIHLDANIIRYLRSVGAAAAILPPYCPFYNPIEYIFGYIKRRCRHIYRKAGEEELALAQAVLEYSDRDYSKVYQKCEYMPTGGFNPATNYKASYTL